MSSYGYATAAIPSGLPTIVSRWEMSDQQPQSQHGPSTLSTFRVWQMLRVPCQEHVHAALRDPRSFSALLHALPRTWALLVLPIVFTFFLLIQSCILQETLLHFASSWQVPAATRSYLHNSEHGDNHYGSCGVYDHCISGSDQYREQ
jgi:hypothetical protein